MLAFVKKKAGFGGELLKWLEPSIQNPNEVLIEVKACGICGSDVHFYEWPEEMEAQLSKAITFPRVLGHEVAGILREVGSQAKDFKVGDQVVCETWGGCGLCYYCRLGRFNHCLYQKRIGQKADGGMAKYVVVPSLSLYKIPENLSFNEGAVVEPLGVALHAFERCHFKAGDDMVIIGPGPIGLLGAMIAQAMGVGKLFVLGLDVDADRLQVASSLGAKSLDITRDDYQGIILGATEGKGVDLVLDVSGGKDSIPIALKLIKQGGEILEVGIGPVFPFDYVELVRKEAILIGSYRRLPSTWMRAINLIASKKVDVRPVMTHLLPLEKTREGFETLRQRKGLKVILNP
ncbi:MAG: alcohol dehydrogenase catalytic domain-containing protein [Deltaproteobacteria bacterium]|nr:alcohol dehydrogenase catalytic domain-containing protein [Deltaproteobacteria bacterium]